ncbi:MAG: glycosyltransferase family 2 protein [Lachnospiraceae bacterium]|nr:glycosyltransferase family 2 protein [Lachnospiraceae bacterium]
MSLPQISVIIPVYNAAKSLSRCIDSLQKQKFSDFEVLLIDDGSTDASSAICDEYGHNDVRIKVIHKENGGVSSARNMGIDIASGKWITFVDSDDWIEGDFLSIPVKYENYDIVLCNYIQLLQNGVRNDIVFEQIETNSDNYKDTICKYINQDILRGPWSKFFKLDWIKRYNIRYDGQLSFAEDMIFNLHCLCRTNQIAFANKGSYVYCYPQNFSSIQKYKIDIKKTIRLREAFKKLSLELSLNDRKFNNHIFWHWLNVEEYCVINGDYSEAERRCYYNDSYQDEIAKSELRYYNYLHRIMYGLCKKIPHKYVHCVVKFYLRIIWKRILK